MHGLWWIIGLIVVLAAVAITLWLVFSNGKSGDSSGGGSSAGNDVDVSAVKVKLIAGEKARIEDNFSDISDYLDLLDDPGNNDYTITAVAECVGTNLAAKVASGDLDADKLLEQMKSPSLSDPNYSAIILEETNCGYDELLTQAEHMYMYSDCVDQGYCTVDELRDFFLCFIGDGSEDNVDSCKNSTNSLCPGNCQLKDLARRNLRAKRRVELASISRR